MGLGYDYWLQTSGVNAAQITDITFLGSDDWSIETWCLEYGELSIPGQPHCTYIVVDISLVGTEGFAGHVSD